MEVPFSRFSRSFFIFFRLHFGEDSHEQQEPIRLKSQTIGKHFIVMTATPQGY
jgi:hypothetical protein